MNGMSHIAAQVVLEGAREMFGPEPVRFRKGSVWREIRDLEDVSILLNNLEDVYGTSGARGLEQRFGRAVFRAGLKQLGGQAGFRSMEYRILPSPRRVEVGLKSLARMVTASLGEAIMVTEDEAYWYWQAARCSECEDILVEKPYCFAMLGLIQEFASWASGGRFYRVVEIECRANGAEACVFRIDKKPLD